jgi:hypothetical protein
MSVNAETVFFFAAGLLTIVSLFRFAIYPVYREVRELLGWWRKFQRDWDGEEPEPGRDRTPGVMARLNEIDGQLRRNGGNSLKDKVFETWRIASDLSERVEAIESQHDRIQEKLGVLLSGPVPDPDAAN